ncbi:peroxisomal membrane protein 11B [Venturia canescens]|uniref:peroxisomal membrane protein 11B n=1 Tax=Venturia canescens TaxID=32260 RepID=UPI001C9C1F4C|nr:peroxisomal membrane protein 11B [Venturia canescens]XP_043280415.1 peroxisomal membrane protein 11B [Venturia canescens]
MDLIVQLNNQTAGRDKIIRLLQYCARAGWYYSRSNASHSSDILKSLEYTFSSFRKLLHFGRCLDSLYGVLNVMQHPDVAIRITMTLSRITNALFLLADHIIWLGRAGVTRVNLEKWTSISHRYWLLSILMNLTRDLYEISIIFQKFNSSQVSRFCSRSRYINFYDRKALAILTSRRDLLLDTIRNSCDLFIPLSALGYTKLSPGTVGLLGVISSAVGIYCLAYPLFKLPAS